MHDPKTVAFEIKSPIIKKMWLFPEGYRETLITIWHVDPETDGTDDSCRTKLTKIENETCEDLIKNDFDNLREWFLVDSEEEAIHKIKRIVLITKRRTLKWHQHWKWHFWHWEIQINFIQYFMRKYFHKCEICKKRGFGKEQAIGWNPGIAHMSCYKSSLTPDENQDK